MTAYNNPELLGLTIVGEVHWHDEPYSFDMTVVWVDAQGNLYYADDAGCSCPGWFEDYHKVDDLTRAGRLEIQEHLDERLADKYGNPEYARGQVAELMLKVVSL